MRTSCSRVMLLARQILRDRRVLSLSLTEWREYLLLFFQEVFDHVDKLHQQSVPGLPEGKILLSLAEKLPHFTRAAHIIIAGVKRRHALHKTISNFSHRDCKNMHLRLGLEYNFDPAYSDSRIRNIIEAEVVTVNNFQWSTEGDDDQVLHDMAAYLQIF